MPTIPGVRFELRFPYVVTIGTVPLEHVHAVRVNVASEPTPGDSFDGIDLTTKGGGTDDLDAYTSTYLALLTAMFSNAADFLTPQLWRGLVGSDDMTMIAVGDTAATGVGTGVVSAAYAVATLRCTDGSILKFTVQESWYSAQTSISFPSGVTEFEAVVTHMTGSGSAVLSARGGVPLAGLRLSGGQNEATWRRRNRP